MKHVLLVRHGESEYNARGLINADPKGRSPLTTRGREQAEQLRRLLRADTIDLCVTSQIPRSIQTAEIALAGRDIPRFQLAEFNDPRAGSLEGASVSEYVRWLRENGRHAPNPGGGESQIDALRRYLAAYRWLADRSEHEILVVAHGLPLAWVRAALGPNSHRPEVNFEHPGIAFAGEPIRLTRAELRRAISVLAPLTGPDLTAVASN
jgi:broad specificity phosphatase PhoE